MKTQNQLMPALFVRHASPMNADGGLGLPSVCYPPAANY